MEYEIGDDPQGLPELPDADPDGGLREDSIFFRRIASATRPGRQGPGDDEDRPVPQMGEFA